MPSQIKSEFKESTKLNIPGIRVEVMSLSKVLAFTHVGTYTVANCDSWLLLYRVMSPFPSNSRYSFEGIPSSGVTPRLSQ